MLDACASGDITALRRFFEARSIRRGLKAVYIATANGAPPTNALLATAIMNGKLEIVSFLLEMYDGISFDSSIITALLDHPDTAILESLYKYDDKIVQTEWDNQITFVTLACERPPNKIAPLLLFLVEHDAALDTGGLPFHFAVHAALCGNQSLRVIEAMIRKGGPVYRAAALQAVLRERVDVIEFFMQYGVELRIDDVQCLRDEADKTENPELVKLVYTWTSGWREEAGGENRGLTVGRKLKQLFGRRG
ncbi:hypothetical protein B0J11DRAFT_512848 [Dendryphion nanum]|uniref:Ankyrin n=1 Tax=Dendryphion nanum TaxID=256645 RepID=A0A9P9I740_9PLEO|nr:hypothetical protein B0J11DRAFT_512848 [Dendryphion nanum]